jgi:hypothetical protein
MLGFGDCAAETWELAEKQNWQEIEARADRFFETTDPMRAPTERKDLFKSRIAYFASRCSDVIDTLTGRHHEKYGIAAALANADEQ